MEKPHTKAKTGIVINSLTLPQDTKTKQAVPTTFDSRVTILIKFFLQEQGKGPLKGKTS